MKSWRWIMSSVSLTKPGKKLGVLIVGLNGAVSTTFLAGTMAVRKGLAQPIGSLTQLGTIRLGKRNEERFPKIKDFVPLADLNSLIFGGWDIRNESCYESAKHAKVLDDIHLNLIKNMLSVWMAIGLKTVKPNTI
jgi:myo-inositol-1-phosphate synthase